MDILTIMMTVLVLFIAGLLLFGIRRIADSLEGVYSKNDPPAGETSNEDIERELETEQAAEEVLDIAEEILGGYIDAINYASEEKEPSELFVYCEMGGLYEVDNPYGICPCCGKVHADKNYIRSRTKMKIRGKEIFVDEDKIGDYLEKSAVII